MKSMKSRRTRPPAQLVRTNGLDFHVIQIPIPLVHG